MTLRPPSDEAMRFPTEKPSCDEVRERIDDLLDGLAPEASVEAHLAACPTCARELALARRLQEALAEGLPPLRCPAEVSEAVLSLAAREAAETTARRAGGGRRPAVDRPAGQGTGRFAWLEDFFGGSVWRPAMAAVVVLLLVAAPVAVWRSLDDGTPTIADDTAPAAGELDGYSTAEVAQAEEEARQVLAYIASVSRDAGEAVRQEVFEERVVDPVRRLAEAPTTRPAGDVPAPAPSDEETP